MTLGEIFRRQSLKGFSGAVLFFVIFSGGNPRPKAQTALRNDEQISAPEYAKAIEGGQKLLKGLIESSKVAGLSVAVAVNEDIVWAEGLGYADLENRVPVTPLTKFRIGSVSKSITAIDLALLYDHGKLNLDAPIQQYVPYFPEKKWPITVRQVAGHLAGIRGYEYANYDPLGDEFLGTIHYASVKDSLNIFAASPLLWEPGTKYFYSTYDYNLLSAVIEGASGQGYINFTDEKVVQRLKLRSTMPDYNDEIVPYRTRFYTRRADGKLVNANFVDLSNKWGGGGWLSTPSDLVRWGSALIGRGFVNERTRKIWWTSQKSMDGKETGYGIGFAVRKDFNGRPMVGHVGTAVGGTTTFDIYPDDGLVMAMTVNMSVSPMNHETAETIADVFLNKKENEKMRLAGLAGNYEFSAQDVDGKRVIGRLSLLNTSDGYRGHILVDKEEPEAPVTRAQDGSYGYPGSAAAEVAITDVHIRDTQVEVIAADYDGFIHMWFGIDGNAVNGNKWFGRGITGTLKVVRK